MKSVFIVLTLLLNIGLFAQVKFENGYIINKEDQRLDCLIRNQGWINNPVEFKYKMQPDGEVLTGTLSEVKEFGVGGSKYVKVTVDIDRSSNDPKEYSDKRNPVWKSETLFLKALEEGKADLYYYRGDALERFFYRIENENFQQLIFKPYKIDYEEFKRKSQPSLTVNASSMKYNLDYMNQLKTRLVCGDVTDKDILHVKYDRDGLKKYFKDYNTCSGGPSSNFDAAYKSVFHLTIAPGIDMATLSIEDWDTDRLKDYPDMTQFRLGIEAEFVLPFNRNKWAIIVEPTYQRYESTEINSVVDYQSIEFPAGIRYYFFLSEHSRIFMNAAVVIDIPLNSTFQWNATTVLEGKNSHNFSLGGGFKFRKYSIEIRQSFNRDVLRDYEGEMHGNYKKLSVIAGFRIF